MINEDKEILNISKLITEDPDIYNTDFTDHEGSGTKEYEAEEVPLPNGEYAVVKYHYTVRKAGRHNPATRLDPPEYPEIAVELVDMEAYDSSLMPIKDPSSLQAAEEYFYSRLKDGLEDKESGF